MTLASIPKYQTGGYIVPHTVRKPEPFAIAAAAIALGLDENEMREFAARVAAMQDVPDIPVEYVYQSMIRIAYEIKERGSTIANG